MKKRVVVDGLVFCQNCGLQVDSSASFCPGCGQSLRAQGPGAPSIAPPSPTPASVGQMPSILTGDGLDLMLYGFMMQFLGFLVTALGLSSIAAAVIGIIILLLGFGMVVYGLNLFRSDYRSKNR